MRIGGGGHAEWTLTAARWSNVAGLAEPFCETAHANTYQWLSDDGKISLLTR
jgi:hypothetical protein